eukprot:Sspe_Gene.36684::Locus_17725_Transcript_1_1_Confidence_1.000_Length_1238::g.36684::m.36684
MADAVRKGPDKGGSKSAPPTTPASAPLPADPPSQPSDVTDGSGSPRGGRTSPSDIQQSPETEVVEAGSVEVEEVVGSEVIKVLRGEPFTTPSPPPTPPHAPAKSAPHSPEQLNFRVVESPPSSPASTVSKVCTFEVGSVSSGPDASCSRTMHTPTTYQVRITAVETITRVAPVVPCDVRKTHIYPVLRLLTEDYVVNVRFVVARCTGWLGRALLESTTAEDGAHGNLSNGTGTSPHGTCNSSHERASNDTGKVSVMSEVRRHLVPILRHLREDHEEQVREYAVNALSTLPHSVQDGEISKASSAESCPLQGTNGQDHPPLHLGNYDGRMQLELPPPSPSSSEESP